MQEPAWRKTPCLRPDSLKASAIRNSHCARYELMNTVPLKLCAKPTKFPSSTIIT